jgi:hypothetical protein
LNIADPIFDSKGMKVINLVKMSCRLMNVSNAFELDDGFPPVTSKPFQRNAIVFVSLITLALSRITTAMAIYCCTWTRKCNVLAKIISELQSLQ